MTIEEKAKAYDEALKVLHKYDGANIMFSQSLKEEMFPELKESEDERIRKALIDGFTVMKESKNCGKTFSNHNIPVVDILAWLEKQGEREPKFRIGDTIKKKSTGDIVIVSEVDLKNREYRLSNTGFIPFKYEYLWELVEQNSADKVEPKFHEGEWLCENEPNNYARFIQILGIVNVQGDDRYRISRDFHKDEDVVEFRFVKKYYHKFSIKDAKEGDVLCCKSGWTCIFKALDYHTNTFSSYCFMDRYKWFCSTGSECHTLDKAFIKAYNGEIYPATKEQRELLFKKMKESGYEWDAEKKELKKIDVRTTGYWHVENVEQKPVWSKEDDYVIERLFCLLHNEQDKYPQQSSEFQELEEIGNKLISFKDRIQLQPKQEWKQENTSDLTDFENAMMHIGGSFFGDNAGLDPNDTNAIKEQANLLLELVPKRELSEEDKNRINRLIAYFEDKESFTAEDDIVYANWLKSLKDRVQPQCLTVTDEELSQAKKDAYNDTLDKIEYHSGEPTFDDGWSAAIWYLKKRLEDACS